MPWRTIHGEECSGYWPAGTAALPRQRRRRRRRAPLRRATGDEDFEREVGLELLVETARLWAASATTTATGTFRIDGVTGPGRVLGARRQQRLHEPHGADEPARGRRGRRAPPRAAPSASASTTTRSSAGARPPTRCSSPTTSELRGPPAGPGLPDPRAWDFEDTPPERLPAAAALPLLRALPQAGRQAGRPRAGAATCAATPSPTSRSGATSSTTRRITVRDSSLSACAQAIVAAEVGPPRARLRLPARGRADGPARPEHNSARRPAHRLARRRGARGDPGWAGCATTTATLKFAPAAARGHHAAALPPRRPRPATGRRGPPRRRSVPARRGSRADRDRALGRARAPRGRQGGPSRAARTARRGAAATAARARATAGARARRAL